MINNDDNMKAMKELKMYMQREYNNAFMSAISKLYNLDKGDLKTDLGLTTQEKDALVHFVPDTAFFMSVIKTVEGIKTEQFDERYQAFLRETREYVDKMVNITVNQPTIAEDIQYDLMGPEFRETEIIEKYGEDVYYKACSEIPEDEDGKDHGRYSTKDFSKANIKLQ